MYSIPSGSPMRAAVLYGLFALPYLYASTAEAATVAPLHIRAPQVTTAPSGTAPTPSVTAVSKCHLHGSEQFCNVGSTEFRVSGTAATASSYTDCHGHGTETFCHAPTGEVQIFLAAEETGHATTPTPTQNAAAAAASEVTAVTGCHFHGTEVLCLAGETEYRVHTTVTATQDLPPSFTGCHTHDGESFCLSPSGDDVEITLATEEGHADHDDHDGESSSGQKCHFHAGVEHCTGSSGEEVAKTCERTQRDYNIKLRVGLLFVMLATSSIGVFTPILISSFVSPKHIAFTILRQFGTGVIISTAFIHLYTHAVLMFQNECLGELSYEATASAILMAGLFLSFLVEYAGSRLVEWHQSKERARNIETGSDSDQAPVSTSRSDMVNITVLESGIIFHSLLIGLTLVVAGDSFFGTLFAVIVFHQMFEGIALGTRIASLGRPGLSSAHGGIHGHGHGPGHGHFHHEPPSPNEPKHTEPAVTTNTNVNGVLPAGRKPSGREELSGSESDGSPTVGESVPHVSMKKKLLLALAFALVTPIGMAIGIGALHQFNGNDPATVIAIGTLDAFSAGILVWVGVVEMWAHDWMLGGEMTKSGPLRTMLGLGALVAGMAIMSLLGKWA
ncbi:hypothetical protein QBC43DRAFT_377249 [Cladorrhinum sp. PSN259]|nr:hypothetical protein QBC43DRAFT_377249 [Cladorrhinum sp. PSN259]